VHNEERSIGMTQDPIEIFILGERADQDVDPTHQCDGVTEHEELRP